MTMPVRFDPEAFYDDEVLGVFAGLRAVSLARGRNDGTLRFTRRGGRILYRGSWITAWLSGEPVASDDPRPELATSA